MLLATINLLLYLVLKYLNWPLDSIVIIYWFNLAILSIFTFIKIIQARGPCYTNPDRSIAEYFLNSIKQSDYFNEKTITILKFISQVFIALCLCLIIISINYTAKDNSIKIKILDNIQLLSSIPLLILSFIFSHIISFHKNFLVEKGYLIFNCSYFSSSFIHKTFKQLFLITIYLILLNYFYSLYLSLIFIFILTTLKIKEHIEEHSPYKPI